MGIDTNGSRTARGPPLRLKGRYRESVQVLGMVTLNNPDMLQNADKCGRGEHRERPMLFSRRNLRVMILLSI